MEFSSGTETSMSGQPVTVTGAATDTEVTIGSMSHGSEASTTSLTSAIMTEGLGETSTSTSTSLSATDVTDTTDAASTTSTTSTTEMVGSSSGVYDDPAIECGIPILDYKCFGAGPEEFLASVQSDVTVPPNSTVDIEIDVTECGDPARRVAGLVVDVELLNACLWSMELSIVCPSGEALQLTTAGMCGVCSDVPKSYHVIFRQSGEVDCTECSFLDTLCIQAPGGGDLCPYLASCQFIGGEPWALRVKTGDTPVTVPSVGLHIALDGMP